MSEPISNYPWPPHFRSDQPPPPNPTDTHVSLTGNITSARDSNLNPDGRVSKPVRRRTRASRRTPTTLLSTDTRNFRAMVQQFTGGPSVSLAPFMSQATPSPASFSSVNTTALPANQIDAGYYQMLMQQNRRAAAADEQSYQMFSFAAVGNRGGGSVAGIDGDYQIQNQNRDSGEMGRINLAGASGFSMDDLIPHHAPPRPPSSN